MNHIFCEFPEKSLARLQKIYQAYEESPKGMLDLVNNTVSHCKGCFDVYLKCCPEWWFERQRLCLNFTPEKIYDWAQLLDNEIFTEYKTCVTLESAYTGFKAIVFLTLEKIKSAQLWSKVKLESITVGKREIGFLLGNKVERGQSWAKAIHDLLAKIPEEYHAGLLDALFELYTADRKSSGDITDLRIDIAKCLDQFWKCHGESLPQQPAMARMVCQDLIKNRQVELAYNNAFIAKFKVLDLNKLFAAVTKFNQNTFGMLVKSIQHVAMTSHLANGALEYLEMHPQFQCTRNDMDMSLLLRRLVQHITRNPYCLTDTMSVRLSKIDFRGLGNNAQWLPYISLFFNIRIGKTAISTAKASLLQQIIEGVEVDFAAYKQDVVADFIRDVKSFTSDRSSTESIAERLSLSLRLNCANACMFLMEFEATNAIARNVIHNLVLEDGGLVELLQIINGIDPALVSLVSHQASKSINRISLIATIKSWMAGQSGNAVAKKPNLTPRVPKVIIKKSNPPGLVPPSYGANKGPQPDVKEAAKSEQNFVQLKRRVAEIMQCNQDREVIIFDRGVAKDGPSPVKDIPHRSKPPVLIDDSDQDEDVVIQKEYVPAAKETPSTKATEPDDTGSSMASIISKRSNAIFLGEKSPAAKDSSDVADDGFFDYVLSPFKPYPDVVRDSIPSTFNSYGEYFEIFSSLQMSETLCAIKAAISENQRVDSCRIQCLNKTFRVVVKQSQLEMHDLVYFTRDRADALRSLNGENMEGFFGVVSSVSSGRSATLPGDLAEIRLPSNFRLPTGWKVEPNEVIFYRFCGNTVTYYREYVALRSIKSSSLLKYILRPSFIRDSYKGDTDWDTKRLCYVNKSSQLSYSGPSDGVSADDKVREYLTLRCKLNASQMEAVCKACYARECFSLIQGPPGTGKTTTIISLIATFLLVGATTFTDNKSISFTEGCVSPLRILVCAPSNTAVDVIVEKLAKGLTGFYGEVVPVKFVRLGVCTNPIASKYTIDYLANQSEKSRPRHSLLLEASVVCATLSSSVSDFVTLKRFDLVIIDEACQATEIGTLVPLRFNPSKVILIGDPCQLPPTVFSQKGYLYSSLFERLVCHQPAVMLTEQYRMHPAISNITSALFYNGQLRTANQTADERLTQKYSFSPLNFIDTSKGKEKLTRLKSYANLAECDACKRICQQLFWRYGQRLKIVVLTPYKGQVEMLKGDDIYSKLGVEINTIDGFQGQECDVLILSTVREHRLGFTADSRRINVAITRSKECLIVLGNKKCLLGNEMWWKILKSLEGTRKYTLGSLNDFLQRL